MVHRGSYLWQYHGAKMFRPKMGGDKNITGYLSREGLPLKSAYMSVLQTENREVKLKLNLQNLPFPACFACACKSGQDNGFDRKPNKRTRSTRS